MVRMTSIITDCLIRYGSLSTSTFPRPRLIAVDMQISQTATTVVFELFFMKQEKLIETALHCLHTSLVLDSRFLATRHTVTSKAVHQTTFLPGSTTRRKGVWLRETK